jgi:hypothetical protein
LARFAIKKATNEEGKLKFADNTCIMAWMDEKISVAEIVDHELCAQAHHGHQQ